MGAVFIIISFFFFSMKIFAVGITAEEFRPMMESHILRGVVTTESLLTPGSDFLKEFPEFAELDRNATLRLMLKHDATKVDTSNAFGERHGFPNNTNDLPKLLAEQYGVHHADGTPNPTVTRLNAFDTAETNYQMDQEKLSERQKELFRKLEMAVDKNDRYFAAYTEASLTDPVRYPPLHTIKQPHAWPAVFGPEFGKELTPNSQYLKRISSTPDSDVLKISHFLEKKFNYSETVKGLNHHEYKASRALSPATHFYHYVTSLPHSGLKTFAIKDAANTRVVTALLKGLRLGVRATPIGAVFTATDVLSATKEFKTYLDGSDFHRDNFFNLPLDEQTKARKSTRINHYAHNLSHRVMRLSCEKDPANGALIKIQWKTMPSEILRYDEESLLTEEILFDKRGNKSIANYTPANSKKPITINFENNTMKDVAYYDPQNKKNFIGDAHSLSAMNPKNDKLTPLDKEAIYFIRHLDFNADQIILCCENQKCSEYFSKKQTQYQWLNHDLKKNPPLNIPTNTQ